MVIKSKVIWSAWAPGVSTKQEWEDWSHNLRGFDKNQKPDVSFIKPMVRRRLSLLAKMVFVTSYSLIDEDQEQLPLVFASRFGEMEKTVQLLTNLVNAEGLSPTSFGLSVHNSLVGMYGMINKWTESSTAIGAGNRSLTSGFIEAYSQSKSFQMPVLYFYYDEPLPEVYSRYDDESLPICFGMIVDAKNDSAEQILDVVKSEPELSPLNLIRLFITKDA